MPGNGRRRNGPRLYHVVPCGFGNQIGVFVKYWDGAHRASSGVRGATVIGCDSLEEAVEIFRRSNPSCKRCDVPIFHCPAPRIEVEVESEEATSAGGATLSVPISATSPCGAAPLRLPLPPLQPAASASRRLWRRLLPGWTRFSRS